MCHRLFGMPLTVWCTADYSVAKQDWPKANIIVARGIAPGVIAPLSVLANGQFYMCSNYTRPKGEFGRWPNGFYPECNLRRCRRLRSSWSMTNRMNSIYRRNRAAIVCAKTSPILHENVLDLALIRNEIDKAHC